MNKIFFKYSILALLILYLSFVQRVLAEDSATPDVTILEFPEIIINEVSFKDSSGDWIELFVVDDNNEDAGSSIMGLKLQDDNVFLEVTEEVEVNTDDYILISLKEPVDAIEVNVPIQIKSSKSGLTGTTEQVILLNNNDEIIDAVCWSNSSPTQSEIEDFVDLFGNQHWHSERIDSCLNSDDISKNHSIARNNNVDTNSSADWDITDQPTKSENNIVIEETPVETIETQINEGIVQEETIQEEVITIVDENICTENIFINEIFPNPEGKDPPSEWIELYNNGENLCSLNGWKIDDEEGGSKPYIISEEINSNGYVLLPSWKTKISLNNTEDSARLFSHEDVLIEEIKYKSTYEQKSYSRFEDEIFEWSKAITPLLQNIASTDSEEISESKSTKKATSKTKKISIKNGDLSDEISLSEIFPNPKGTDKGNEWIEIHNDSKEEINLGNWIIDTGENGKKSYTFDNKTIKPDEYLVIDDAQLNFSLTNSGGTIRLINFNQEVIDEMEYESAKDGQSLAKIKIINGVEEEEQIEWSKNPTPGVENLKLYVYEGLILEFDEIKGILRINTEDLNEITISVLEDGEALLSQIFKEGTKIRALVNKQENDTNLLEKYEILETEDLSVNNNNNEQSLLYIILSSIPPLGFFGYMGVKKYLLAGH